MMKLAYVFDRRLPSPAIRGGAIQLLIDGVLPYLRKKNRITIFSIKDPKLPNKEKRGSVKYIRLSPDNYFKKVSKYLAKGNFDLIHVLNRPDKVPDMKKAAPKSRFVISLHNDRFSEDSISKEVAAKSIESVKNIFTVSDYIKDTVKKRFPQAAPKLVTVYSGVNIKDYISPQDSKADDIRKKLRKKYGITSDKKVILFAGRLIEKKGPHLLIEAMKDVMKKHKDAVLVISGGKYYSDNGMTEYVKSLYKMAKPLGDKVVFTKFIKAEKMPEYYLMADLFVCSSQWNDPAARIHYEAMAAGTPIITTNRGGTPEIIKHGYNGLVLNDYSNPRAFANAIDYLLSNPKEAERLSRNGRELVKKRFQFIHTAKRWHELYKAAIKGRKKK